MTSNLDAGGRNNSVSAKSSPTESSMSPTSETERAELTLWRFRTAVVLLVTFIVLLFGAAWIYPSHEVVVSPPAVQILITTDPSGSYNWQTIWVDFSKIGPDRFKMTLWTLSGLVVGTVYSEVKFPKIVGLSEKCVTPPRQCSYGEMPQYSPIPTDNFIATSSSSASVSVGQLVLGSWIIRSRTFAWNDNGLNAEVALPAVSVSTGDPTIEINFQNFDTASYDFVNGLTPVKRGVWATPASNLSVATALSGTNNNAASHDSFLTFLSGALLGVAGGSIVASAQEFSDRLSDALPEKKRRRRRS